jgi:integrase/recombinase XerC
MVSFKAFIRDSMIVKVADGKEIDLSKSLLTEDSKFDGSSSLQDQPKVSGVVVLDPNMKVMPLVSNYLTFQLKYNNISYSSALTFGRNLGYFIDYLNSHKHYKYYEQDSALLDVQEHTIKEYFVDIKSAGLSSQTIRNRDAALLSFFNGYLCSPRGNRPELRKDNPYRDGLLTGSPKSTQIEMCSLDELIALLRCTSNERERALLQFMYDSGVRRSEIPRVSKSHIETAINSNRNRLIVDDDTISVPPDYAPVHIEGSKGRKREIRPRTTIVSRETLKRVARYHSSPLYRSKSRKFGSDKPAFLNAEGNNYKSSSISKLLERLSKRAMKRNLIKRSVSPHMLRHGFAGGVLRSPDLGKDAVDRLVIVQRCLGHASLVTTQVYTNLPFDIHGKLVNNDGEVLTRSQIMSRVWSATKRVIKLSDNK